jgi:hypothetical protein
MGRKRAPKEKFARLVGVRISQRFHDRLEEIRKNSNCQYISEVVRRILYREEIIWYHKDASMDSTVAELALIRKELNAIGININQITRHFHGADTANQKIIQAIKVVEEYKKVGHKLDRVMDVTSEITKKWLQK